MFSVIVRIVFFSRLLIDTCNRWRHGERRERNDERPEPAQSRLLQRDARLERDAIKRTAHAASHSVQLSDLLLRPADIPAGRHWRLPAHGAHN